jgi:hypothetical protein
MLEFGTGKDDDHCANRRLAQRAQSWHHSVWGSFNNNRGGNMLMKTESRPIVIDNGPKVMQLDRPSKVRFAMAFGVAALSDIASMLTEFAPPIQWVIDLATAGLLFMILGRRWALLPGLLVEAIPGMGVFPVWLLVVMSLFFYDEIKLHKPVKTHVAS